MICKATTTNATLRSKPLPLSTGTRGQAFARLVPRRGSCDPGDCGRDRTDSPEGYVGR